MTLRMAALEFHCGMQDGDFTKCLPHDFFQKLKGTHENCGEGASSPSTSPSINATDQSCKR